MNYNDLITEINQDAPVKIERRDRSVGMVKHYHPLSLTELEFNFVTDFVKKYNLKRGYEVATAFGISGLAAGLGFKETGGLLVTMDAYIEEQYNDCGKYIGKKSTHTNADGYQLAQHIFAKYNVPVYMEIGWSPDDTTDALSNTYDLSKDRLDYVFIDAGHWREAILADINSVIPFLSNKYVIFFHDIHCFDNDMVHYVESTLNGKIIEPFPRNNANNYGLAYITNL
jgi:predicted O-methyltransferase YrrM